MRFAAESMNINAITVMLIHTTYMNFKHTMREDSFPNPIGNP